jgi:hypothetical protein
MAVAQLMAVLYAVGKIEYWYIKLAVHDMINTINLYFRKVSCYSWSYGTYNCLVYFLYTYT